MPLCRHSVALRNIPRRMWISSRFIILGLRGSIYSEIIAHTPYSFPTDVWSLGCLMVTSLSGTLTSEVGQSGEDAHIHSNL